MSSIEKKHKHFYICHGLLLEGYGSSMDPHRCGDESEPCVKFMLARTVTPWFVTDTNVQGSLPEKYLEKLARLSEASST